MTGPAGTALVPQRTQRVAEENTNREEKQKLRDVVPSPLIAVALRASAVKLPLKLLFIP